MKSKAKCFTWKNFRGDGRKTFFIDMWTHPDLSCNKQAGLLRVFQGYFQDLFLAGCIKKIAKKCLIHMNGRFLGKERENIWSLMTRQDADMSLIEVIK